MTSKKAISIHQAAIELGLTKRELFKFLRKYNFLIDSNLQTSIAPSLLAKNYFEVQYKDREVGRGYHKIILSISVTPQGMRFLRQVLKLLTSKI